MAEAWVVLQVEYRHKLGIRVDYKAAQHEGEWQATFHNDLFVTFHLLLFFFFTARQCALDALDDANET